MEVKPFIIDRAIGFYQLAVGNDGRFQQEMAATMSFAFACELILKGMSEKKIHDHNLANLFNSLSDKRKIWLVTLYREQEDRDLSDDLQRCANLFYEFRYYHEKKAFAADTGLIRRLARFLVEAGTKAIADRPDMQFLTF